MNQDSKVQELFALRTRSSAATAGLILFFWTAIAAAASLDTNSVRMEGAPTWLKPARVERVVSKIQNTLEWDIRKVQAYWYSSPESFSAIHGFGSAGSAILAVTRRSDQSMHLGPQVSSDNFDGIFGHELVHVILAQKYKDAIPSWLEEGLANYAAKKGSVDYKALARRSSLPDLRSLKHPFGASAKEAPLDHYQLSRAAAEMLASKCSLTELLQLSVGKSLENYLATLCEIPDLNAAFRAWVKRKSR